MALAYARSRQYEEFRDGDWRAEEGAPDLNRIARQQNFLRIAAAAVLDEVNTTRSGSATSSTPPATSSASTPTSIVIDAGEAMFAAAEDGLHTYVPPVEELIVGDQSALQLGEGADEILDYFRGIGPLPPVTESSAPTDTAD